MPQTLKMSVLYEVKLRLTTSNDNLKPFRLKSFGWMPFCRSTRPLDNLG